MIYLQNKLVNQAIMPKRYNVYYRTHFFLLIIQTNKLYIVPSKGVRKTQFETLVRRLNKNYSRLSEDIQ